MNGENNTYGLVAKYNVTKIDTNETVFNSFVLRPDKDIHAQAALYTYALSCANEKLKQDINAWLTELGFVPAVNSLAAMMDQQEKWQNDLGYKFDEMTIETRVAYAKEMSIHMTQELHESLYELPYFKPWKNYSDLTFNEGDWGYCSIKKAQDEVVDMWHFFMNYMLALGMTAEDLYKGYKEKNAENYKRQEEGYTHDKSYRG